ncbi:MAG: hypothetical protein ABGY96_18585 [bacterium]|nr:hypothetical protein [Gammaproteobacteria bacterium]HIL97766.1 hypothetical protein [Pseudomonadales bacterium]
MNYQLIPAIQEKHREIFSNLLSLYLYDLSEFFDMEPEEGRYNYEYQWTDLCKNPFLVYKGAIPVGFAIVTTVEEKNFSPSGEKNDWDMEEFFVIRSERREGLGLWLAHEMYRKFPGKWQIRIGEKNLGALSFWRNSLKGIGCTNMEEIYIEGQFGFFHCINVSIPVSA